MEEETNYYDASSFERTKCSSGSSSRIQAAWCCLQQTFAAFTSNDSKSFSKDVEVDFTPPSSTSTSHKLPVEPETSSRYGFRHLRPLSAVKNLRNRSIFGSMKSSNDDYSGSSSTASKSSYFPGMNSMHRCVGIPFDHLKYSYRSNSPFETSSDIATDDVSETGQVHLSKLSAALDDQFRDLESDDVHRSESDVVSEHATISSYEPSHKYSVDSDVVSVTSTMISEIADEHIGENIKVFKLSRVKKLAEVVLAQSEVLQLQERHSDAAHALEKMFLNLKRRKDQINDELSSSCEDRSLVSIKNVDGSSRLSEIRDLNVILLKFCKRLGAVHKLLENLSSAEEYLMMAISLLSQETTFDDNEKICRELSNAYSSLAIILDEMGKHEEAVTADQKAIENLSYDALSH